MLTHIFVSFHHFSSLCRHFGAQYLYGGAKVQVEKLLPTIFMFIMSYTLNYQGFYVSCFWIPQTKRINLRLMKWTEPNLCKCWNPIHIEVLSLGFYSEKKSSVHLIKMCNSIAASIRGKGDWQLAERTIDVLSATFQFFYTNLQYREQNKRMRRGVAAFPLI